MTKEIQLTKGQVALVDDDIYEYISQWSWNATKNKSNWYARRTLHAIKKQAVFMHRLIVNAPKGSIVDHVNGDGLDNRRENLRVCTNGENLCNRGKTRNNTSGYKGVVFNKETNNFRAYIKFDGNARYLGIYVTAEEAARVYDEAAKEYHGEFAKLNFPVWTPPDIEGTDNTLSGALSDAGFGSAGIM